MADQAKSAKGNPAHQRMSNKALKERRASSWARGEKRKDARRRTQEAAHKGNLAVVALGQLTPWQQAQVKRAERRSQDPRVLKARRRHMADTLQMPVVSKY